MFYITETFLEGESQKCSSHAAVISAFGRDFARLGKVPHEFHRFLIDAQLLRQTGDYGQFQSVSEQQVNLKIEWLEQFLYVATEHFI